ncbi:MAG: hypothetical protein M1504_03850 [Candidatus Marsarchaeota archaeon]|nr:hypothetical protein [Candidatus Marsarchaeota archaeon]
MTKSGANSHANLFGTGLEDTSGVQHNVKISLPELRKQAKDEYRRILAAGLPPFSTPKGNAFRNAVDNEAVNVVISIARENWQLSELLMELQRMEMQRLGRMVLRAKGGDWLDYINDHESKEKILCARMLPILRAHPKGIALESMLRNYHIWAMQRRLEIEKSPQVAENMRWEIRRLRREYSLTHMSWSGAARTATIQLTERAD